MKKNIIILLGGLTMSAFSIFLYYLDFIGPKFAYFLVLISFLMVISPVVIYIFNKQN
ncbi:MAG: hypothetical protein LBE34_07500 [Flavobacteriaceae bacterium]|nr:hypothetical protein [Flavobacteriaceae bacterium]